jgi:hypothetical protein
MKLDEEDEEDEEDEPEEGGLAGFMKNPMIQNMLIQQLTGMFMPNTTKVTNVAGVLDSAVTEQDEKIDEAIETLKQFSPNLGDDLILLAQLALNDPKQFQFLLKMLRS